MMPMKFDEANKVWTPPAELPDCGTLPAHVTKDGLSISCWHATFRERLRFLFTGRIWLWVWGRQPPVAVDVAFPFEPQKDIEHAQGEEE